jgi:hypothetical protein
VIPAVRVRIAVVGPAADRVAGTVVAAAVEEEAEAVEAAAADSARTPVD